MTPDTEDAPIALPYRISALLDHRPRLRSQLQPFHPLESAALVAGLLVDPSFHANTLRIEMLVHLLACYAEGEKKPTRHRVGVWLNDELRATVLADLEDPVEDVFIGNVTTDEGNIRIFMGLWESTDFYLQRILNVVQTLPSNPGSAQLKREIRAILRLSEEIARRCCLPRYTPGNGRRRAAVVVPPSDRLESLRRTIEFSVEDLTKVEVRPNDIRPFILPPHRKDLLRKQEWGDSDLERHPVLTDGQKWVVLLPSAISIAVRHHVLTWMRQNECEQAFDESLIVEYHRLLWETRILGLRLPRNVALSTTAAGGRMLAECVLKVDEGRHAHAVFIVDRTEEYVEHGLHFSEQDSRELTAAIDHCIMNARSHFTGLADFRQGLTLLVDCGYGRPLALGKIEETENWLVEFISAPDLETLSWATESSRLMLWKLVDYARFLAKNGISVTNPSGLLNLYAWWLETKYWMLPPDVGFGETSMWVSIPTDSLATVRQHVRQGWDVHSVPLPDGRYTRVRRNAAETHFQDEAEKHKYACIDAAMAGAFLGAWIDSGAVWWVAADPGNSGLPRETVWRIWSALYNWIERIFPAVTNRIPTGCMPQSPLFIVADLCNLRQDVLAPVLEETLRSCLSVSTQAKTATIRISIHTPFIAGSRDPKNVAERMLVRATVDGVFRIAGQVLEEEALDGVVGEIVPNDDARHFHLFAAHHFAEHMRAFDRPEALLADGADEARSKIGLGWLVQKERDRSVFNTPKESTRFLNDLVEALWGRVRDRLAGLNRVDFVEKALRHIEGAEADKRHWEHTLRAVIALREDRTSTMEVAMKEIGRFNASAIALRLLVEMAVSTCPLGEGMCVGALDLGPLMCDVMGLFQLGGWSDAINKGVMNPEIVIRPSGDVCSHTEFQECIVEPLGRSLGSRRLDNEASQYDGLFEHLVSVPNTDHLFAHDFVLAFKEEFGVSIDSLRAVRDSLQDLALAKKKCVFVAREEDVLRNCEESGKASVQTGRIVLKRFSLWPRAKWDETPAEFRAKDWYPWRFGRRLSLLARPLLRLEQSDNPPYMISPGLLDMGIVHTLQRYSHAEVDVSDCTSRQMREWVTNEQARRAQAFEVQVSDAMRSLGYETKLRVSLASLLDEKLDKDYGDVDVLAWRPAGSKALAIECKNLRTARTMGEMAEQLSRFGGQTLRDGRPDDLLKHVDRVRLLNEKSQRLAKTTGLGEHRSIKVHALVCFSNPAPMQYVAVRFPSVKFVTIDDLHKQV